MLNDRIQRLLTILLLSFSGVFSQTDPFVTTRPIITGESPNLSARRDMSDRNLSLGAPRFVEPGLYNAFDHNGVAIGLLEREKDGVSLGTRYLKSSQENEKSTHDLSSRNFMLPYLGFTIENILSSQMYYRTINDVVDSDDGAEMTMHMGGMDLGFGATSKKFQMGLSLHGGRAEGKDWRGNKKIMYALPKIDLSMGSEVHSTVRIGGHVGVGATFDSTRSDVGGTQTWERIFDLELPNYGFYADIGDTALFPLLSNISLNLYTLRQIGTWKQNIGSFNGEEYQYNPLWHSGHTFKFKSTYRLENQGLVYWPSLLIEKWGRSTQRYHFDPSNNQDPFGETGKCEEGEFCYDANNDSWYVPEGKNHQWFFSGFNFGLGGFVEIFNYASTFVEYEIHTLNFEVENDGSLDEDDVYHRILIGTEGKLHNIPQWKIPQYLQILLRASFSTGEDNETLANYRPYQFQFFDRYTSNLNGRDYSSESYYKPVYGNPVDWFNFNFGLGAVFYNKIQTDLYLSLYSIEEIKRQYNGIELGASLQINL